MAWTTPHSWRPLEMMGAGAMNSQLRDNLLHLKTRISNAGVPLALLWGNAFSAGQSSGGGGADTQLSGFNVTVPANYLSVPGASLLIDVTWTHGAQNEAKTVKFKVGGGTLISVFTLTLAVSYPMIGRLVITRRTSTTGGLVGLFTLGSHNTAVASAIHTNSALGAVNWATDQIMYWYATTTTATALRLNEVTVTGLGGISGTLV